MSSTLQLEQNLIEAIRALTPEKQQSVLDFAEFLCSQQNQTTSPQFKTETTTKPTVVKEHTELDYDTLDLAEHKASTNQAINPQAESTTQQVAISDDFSFDPDATPLWEMVAQISAQVPDEEWQKLPTDLARKFDHYQKQRQHQD